MEDNQKIWTLVEFGKLTTEEQNGAFKFENVTKYYHNGEYHRLDGPAVLYNTGRFYWFKYGKLHRLDGPAMNHRDKPYFYIDGKEYQFEDWEKLAFAILNNLEAFL